MSPFVGHQSHITIDMGMNRLVLLLVALCSLSCCDAQQHQQQQQQRQQQQHQQQQNLDLLNWDAKPNWGDVIKEQGHRELENKAEALLDTINKTHHALIDYHRGLQTKRAKAGQYSQQNKNTVLQADGWFDWVAPAVNNVVNVVKEVVVDVVSNIAEVFGLDESIDNRSYPRIEPECRFDDSAMPGLACSLRLEFSEVAVLEVALNAEFGLTDGGSILITKLSTGIKTASIPESCDIFGFDLIMRGLCTIAELAAGLFEKTFDLGGIVSFYCVIIRYPCFALKTHPLCTAQRFTPCSRRALESSPSSSDSLARTRAV
jgi:hypothetical protein